jgi:hypothetical protein
LKASQQRIETAVQRASLERMQQTEMATASARRREISGARVRQGSSGAWRDYFGEREKALLAADMTPTLARLGYVSGEAW